MEPNFQVETAHDQDAYNNMVTAHYMLHEKNSIKSLYALAVVLALCVWWIAAGGNYTSIRALGSGITTLAIVLLLVPYVDRFAARQVCHRLLDRVVKAAKKTNSTASPPATASMMTSWMPPTAQAVWRPPTLRSPTWWRLSGIFWSF